MLFVLLIVRTVTIWSVAFPRRFCKGKEAVAFLKKSSAKNFCSKGALMRPMPPRSKKVFCFFFSKKKCFLPQRPAAIASLASAGTDFAPIFAITTARWFSTVR